MLDMLRRYRWTELTMLFVVALVVTTGILQLVVIRSDAKVFNPHALPPLFSLFPALGFIAVLFIAHLILSLVRPRADQLLLPLAALLSAIGLLMSERLGPDVGEPALGSKQLLWVTLGVAACLGIVLLLKRVTWLQLYKYTWAVIGLILVAATLIHARGANFNSPTHDVLYLGSRSFAFQPSEVLKVCLVIFFAGYLNENREVLAKGSYRLGPLTLPPLRQLGPLLVMLGISLLFFVILRELGLALLLFGIFLAMVYMASERMLYVWTGLLLFFAGASICYRLFGYVRDRVAVAFDPFKEGIVQNTGFQIAQGLIAISSGGFLGAGLGLGHPAFVPAVQTDFVFAAVGEELGMAGLLAMLSIYVLLVYRGFRIAMLARDPFNQLLAAGLTAIIAIQTLVIVAGNLKVIPLTGITLPFVSYGGSSLLINFAIIGLLLRISTEK